MEITEAMIRAEVLREFAEVASIGRPSTAKHKPSALDDRFQMTLTGDDPKHLEVQYAGKRRAEVDFPAEALTWALDRFNAQIAKPLAVKLFNSYSGQ